MTRLPPARTLQNLSVEEQSAVVDTLFEHSPVLRSVILPLIAQNFYPSYPALIAHVGDRLAYMLHTGEIDKIDAILSAHPRLGERRERVSDLSRMEQANLNNTTSSTSQEQQQQQQQTDSTATESQDNGGSGRREETGHMHRISGNIGISNELRRWNELYEERFPGLRYVTFVNSRPREVVIQDMINRIHRGDIDRERSEAVSAICLIAVDRARRLDS
ncbi:hypothetical protein KEM54_006417 [Ascosphaera aggregata]|nr:hypothetical protein KEM54_006417 [Ascosphaera aggregata]